jgi:SAM-dependent methyltransferase
MTEAIDVKAAKERELAAWTATAAGWNKHHALLERFSAPVSEKLIENAGIQPSMRVLDIACGTGQPAITVAERVGAHGSVLATDFVEPVIAYARMKAKERGLINIEFRCVDGEALDVPANNFDAVTMRWGIMFMPSPVESMKGAHAALRRGGRIALTAWASPRQNPFVMIALGVIGKYLDIPTSPPGTPGLFAFADQARLRSTIEAGGFGDVQIEPFDFVVGEFASGEEYWTFMREVAAPVARLYGQCSSDDQRAIDREIHAEAERSSSGDKVVVRGTTWIAWGCK